MQNYDVHLLVKGFFSTFFVEIIWFVSDSGFVMLQGTTYWTDLFVRHFLFQTEHCIDCDDLLFFVRKRHVRGSSRYLPKFEVNFNVILRSKLLSL